MSALDSGRESLLAWLLEPETPSARYLALTELLDRVPAATAQARLSLATGLAPAHSE